MGQLIPDEITYSICLFDDRFAVVVRSSFLVQALSVVWIGRRGQLLDILDLGFRRSIRPRDCTSSRQLVVTWTSVFCFLACRHVLALYRVQVLA